VPLGHTNALVQLPAKRSIRRACSCFIKQQIKKYGHDLKTTMVISIIELGSANRRGYQVAVKSIRGGEEEATQSI